MSQSKAHSALESCTNVVIGYVVALISQVAIFKAYGIPVRLDQNIAMGLWFTGVSLVRSYSVRRLFNQWHSSHSETTTTIDAWVWQQLGKPSSYVPVSLHCEKCRRVKQEHWFNMRTARVRCWECL